MIEFIVLHHYVNDPASTGKQRQLALAMRGKKQTYHYCVLTNGEVVSVTPDFKAIGHCGADYAYQSKNKKTSNFNSLAVCAMGNFEKYPMKTEQFWGIVKLLATLSHKYKIPNDNIVRHSDVWNTQCPGRLYPFESIKKGVLSMLKPRQIILKPGNNEITVDGKRIMLKKEPVNQWGTTVLPLREVLEQIFGYNVKWDENTKHIICSLEEE